MIGGQFCRHAAVEVREVRDHVGHQEHHQASHQEKEHRRIQQRHHHFLLHRQRQFLIADVAVQHFAEAAAFLAGHDGGDVNFREQPLHAKRFRQHDAVADFVAHRANVRTEFGVGEAVRQQFERFQNRQPGAHQGDELLVEDQEFFQIQFLAASEERDLSGHACNGTARTNRIQQEALLRKAFADLRFGRSLGHLLVDFAARVGILENPLGHFIDPPPRLRFLAER